MEENKAWPAWVRHDFETTKPIPEQHHEIEPSVQFGASPR